MDAGMVVGLVEQAVMRAGVPGVSAGYLRDWFARNRGALTSMVDTKLGPLLRAPAGTVPTTPMPELPDGLPETWTAAERTRVNLAAMHLVASGRRLSANELRVVAGYTGWGGLAIEKHASAFPAGLPAPEARGLIHEFYTPTKLSVEVGRVVRDAFDTLPFVANGHGSVVRALEPAAGIGRLLRSVGTTSLRWTAVEWSVLSAKMLAALVPELDLYQGPFERWVRDHGDDRFGLVVSNPPYGTRGAAVAEDPVRAYRETRAYAYFLRRGLDLLLPGGLGVFLIPGGFLTGKGSEAMRLRNVVLRRHHLAAAFRLPSSTFPGAMLVTDLLFFRARPGELPAVDAADEAIAAGSYFREYPAHILGTEVGTDEGDDDRDRTLSEKKPRARFGYQVEGNFERIPPFDERAICASCEIRSIAPTGSPRIRRGAVRIVKEEEQTTGLSADLSELVKLGLRVDQYLSEAAAGTEQAVMLHAELVAALTSWGQRHGNPWTNMEIRQLANAGNIGAERALVAFTKSGALADAIARVPKFERPFRGAIDDVGAVADHLWRQEHIVYQERLVAFHRSHGGSLSEAELASRLTRAGWYFDDPPRIGASWWPPAAFLTGNLWPRYDRAYAAGRRETAAALLRAIKPAVFDDIEGVTPQQKWVPLDLVSAWMNETINAQYTALRLVFQKGLVQLDSVTYGAIEDASISAEALWCIGWINHDRVVFSPRHSKEESIDDKRLEYATAWLESFKNWISKTEDRRLAIERAYQRRIQGFIPPTYTAEPLTIARWGKEAPRPHPHQISGARRVLANRGGLVAFDVGVGKTFTGLLILARARQEGWARRPVIVVPNSIIWKWAKDIARCLPDYRVCVIGSKLVTITRGPRKGVQTSKTDSPQERAEKWTAFQSGAYDVALVTYTALPRTRMNEDLVLRYAVETASIQRELELRRRNAEQAGRRITERQKAILEEGMGAWVAEQMELPEDWQYDPGLAWDDLKVDLLIVDEAQNFKNLFLPEQREGGVPRFMGSAGEGSKRAWQLDFRCAAVHRNTGGAGVVLLSATPAKNSPLEFYNIIRYVDVDAWDRMGIPDPESYIDRYCRIQMRDVLDSALRVTQRSACTGFMNLHELREVIYRYGEFKTAEDVGIRLPEPKVNLVEVDMDEVQDAKYETLVYKVEKTLESTDPREKAQILGLLARMSLVAIHGNMDEVNVGEIVEHEDGRKTKRVNRGERRALVASFSAHSPKFDAMRDCIKNNRACGHIVFLDNLAGHEWVRRVLVEGGIAPERIALLNGEAAPEPAERQRIAQDFNGDPDNGVPPRYDVVICNAVAYEGIDLQTRTCAIHHLDLPWEPATLQQRNGRGVRQGNTLATIEINYYFARRSMDGQRFDLIRNKQGWMSTLLASQARDTNNPAAQSSLSSEEILVLISRDPDKTRARLQALRETREKEARERVAVEAVRIARAAAAKFRRAERTEPEVASVMRAEGEARLAELARLDPAAWPWAAWAVPMRERHILIPSKGPPVYEGLRFQLPDAISPEQLVFIEIGTCDPLMNTFYQRRAGEALFRGPLDLASLELFDRAQRLEQWPEEDVEKMLGVIQARVRDSVRFAQWARAGFIGASEAWRETWWPRLQGFVAQGFRNIDLWQKKEFHLPVRVGRTIAVISSVRLPEDAELVPPTFAGWTEFLEKARTAGETWTTLNNASNYWWMRSIPRNLLAQAEGDAE